MGWKCSGSSAVMIKLAVLATSLFDRARIRRHCLSRPINTMANSGLQSNPLRSLSGSPISYSRDIAPSCLSMAATGTPTAASARPSRAPVRDFGQRGSLRTNCATPKKRPRCWTPAEHRGLGCTLRGQAALEPEQVATAIRKWLRSSARRGRVGKISPAVVLVFVDSQMDLLVRTRGASTPLLPRARRQRRQRVDHDAFLATCSFDTTPSGPNSSSHFFRFST